VPLDELIDCIEDLKRVAAEHAAVLTGHEMQTRYGLRDPLLRVLGWDTGDASQVRLEYGVGRGNVDYALLNSGTVEVMIEAKALGTALAGALPQAINYGITGGARFYVLTNGAQWEIYDTNEPPARMKVVEWDLLSEDATDIARKVLALWRPNKSRQPGQPPIVGPSQPAVQVSSSPPPSPSPPVAGSQAQVPLGTAAVKFGDVPPKKLSLPDGQIVSIQYWKDILRAVAQHLDLAGQLNPSARASGHGRYITHQQPTHPNGRAFFNPFQVGSCYLETHASGPQLVANAVHLIKASGQDTGKYILHFDR